MLLALPEVRAHNVLKPLGRRLHLLPDGPMHRLLPAHDMRCSCYIQPSLVRGCKCTAITHSASSSEGLTSGRQPGVNLPKAHLMLREYALLALFPWSVCIWPS